jgi:predicted benzoate:H+ symporter BenE
MDGYVLIAAVMTRVEQSVFAKGLATPNVTRSQPSLALSLSLAYGLTVKASPSAHLAFMAPVSHSGYQRGCYLDIGFSGVGRTCLIR